MTLVVSMTHFYGNFLKLGSMISLGILPAAIIALPLGMALSTSGRLRILPLRLPALILPGL